MAETAQQGILRCLENYAPEPNTGCWLWCGRTDRHGYGQLKIAGRNALAHRIFYQELVGEIGQGLVIDHLCRQRICVNPRHMEPVTLGVNLLRGMAPAAQNARAKHCKRGHPFDETNTYFWFTTRKCRACRKASDALRAQNKRSQRAPQVQS